MAESQSIDNKYSESEIKPEIDPTSTDARNTFYSFNAKDISGKMIYMSDFKEKILLIVNVASECGFTENHYKAMVNIQDVLGQTGKFSVLAFPCNQFGAQEPGTNEEIAKFARETYNVNFPIFAKINVVEDNVPPVWKYLAEKTNQKPNWNFWKYLVNSEGEVLQAWGPWSDWMNEVVPVIQKEIDKLEVKHQPNLPSADHIEL